MWITSMGNHGAAEGISERRRSGCSSFQLETWEQTSVNFNQISDTSTQENVF